MRKSEIGKFIDRHIVKIAFVWMLFCFATSAFFYAKGIYVLAVVFGVYAGMILTCFFQHGWE